MTFIPDKSNDGAVCFLPPCSLTFLPVVALHIYAEDGDLLPLDLIFVDVDVGDGDAPGRQVPQGAWCAGLLSRGVVLHHHGRLLHLQGQKESNQRTITIHIQLLV